MGFRDGMGTAAMFNGSIGLAVDAAGNLYVADSVNCMVRKITSAGLVTTLAGSGSEGKTNGKGKAAAFSDPYSVAVDASGNVYVADYGNNLIRKITSAGVVTTLAGSGVVGSTNGAGTAASFHGPTGVAVDASGNVYVGDSGNNLIRKMTPAGLVSTLAGSAGAAGFRDGIGTAALFKDPSGIAVDTLGNLYVADSGNSLIRKITAAGVVSTLAGCAGVAGNTNGVGKAALFYGPFGVAVDLSGNVYVADTGNELIRKITP
jgi:sugar lactone lactonase YvrE